MDAKINVLDITIDNCTAKQAMKEAMAYMESEPVNLIDLVTVDSVMQLSETPEVKEELGGFDLVLAGDRTILEAANIRDRKALQEAENRVFLKMLLRYFHKTHRRLYLLVESEADGSEFLDHLERRYGGIQIVGMAKVSAADRADDMLVNAINAGEVDCVLSALESPLQEAFIARSRTLLNTRLWMGVGAELFPADRKRAGKGRLGQFLMKLLFKKEMEKRKRQPEEQENAGQ